MLIQRWRYLTLRATEAALSVPVRIKIIGIMVVPLLILGVSLNYWVRGGLSDWLSWLLESDRVALAMAAGSRSVLLVTGLAAAVSVALTYELMIELTRPLLQLQRVAERVARGELEIRAKVSSRDEIGSLARAVNTMIDRLVHSQQELRQTNRRLAALVQVASAVGTGLDLDEVLHAALVSTLDVLGLDRGWIYLREPDGPGFRVVTALRSAEDPRVSASLAAAQLCACQQALLTGELAGPVSLRRCDRYPEAAGLAGRPPAHLTIQLEARGERVGVLNLLWTNEAEPREDEMELLAALGVAISAAVANAWLHASVLEEQAARQALLGALVRAQEDERGRVARELHDGAGQALTSWLLQLKALESVREPERVQAGLEELCGALSKTIDQIRDLSHSLRPPAIEELGLEAALEALIEDATTDAGLDVRFFSDLGVQRLPAEVETTVYRITQEALTNVVRHARATTVTIEITSRADGILLVVEDDGRGFDVQAISGDGGRHLGLVGIHERAEALRGEVALHSAPNAGTRLEVRLPVLLGVEA